MKDISRMSFHKRRNKSGCAQWLIIAVGHFELEEEVGKVFVNFGDRFEVFEKKVALKRE